MEQARVAAEAVLLLHVLWCRLGVAGLDCNTRPARPADAAYYFARIRDHHRAGFLAAVPAHRGRNSARSSSGDRTHTRTVPRARARRDCLPRSAGVALLFWPPAYGFTVRFLGRRSRRSDCLLGDPGCLFDALSTSPTERYVVIRAC